MLTEFLNMNDFSLLKIRNGKITPKAAIVGKRGIKKIGVKMQHKLLELVKGDYLENIQAIANVVGEIRHLTAFVYGFSLYDENGVFQSYQSEGEA